MAPKTLRFCNRPARIQCHHAKWTKCSQLSKENAVWDEADEALEASFRKEHIYVLNSTRRKVLIRGTTCFGVIVCRQLDDLAGPLVGPMGRAGNWHRLGHQPIPSGSCRNPARRVGCTHCLPSKAIVGAERGRPRPRGGERHNVRIYLPRGRGRPRSSCYSPTKCSRSSRETVNTSMSFLKAPRLTRHSVNNSRVRSSSGLASRSVMTLIMPCPLRT